MKSSAYPAWKYWIIHWFKETHLAVSRIRKFIQRGWLQLSLIYYLNWIFFPKDRFGCDQFTLSSEESGRNMRDTEPPASSLSSSPPLLPLLPLLLFSVHFTGRRIRFAWCSFQWTVVSVSGLAGLSVLRVSGGCMCKLLPFSEQLLNIYI